MDTTALARRLLDPVPVHRAAGLEVVRSGDARAEVALETIEPLTNVIGALGAGSLTTLVDAGGLAAIIAAAEDEAELEGVLPLGAAASMRFLAPAYGRVVATCALSDEARGAIRSVLDGSAGRARLETTTHVHDGGGVLVCEGTFSWSLRR